MRLIARYATSVRLLLLCAVVLPALLQAAPPERHELRQAIQMGAEYLRVQVKQSGQFVYRVNMNPAVQVKPRYNLLRHAGIAFLLSAQIADGPYRGGFPRAIGPREGDSRRDRSFNDRCTEIRIDYVQHVLSALLVLHDRH